MKLSEYKNQKYNKVNFAENNSTFIYFSLNDFYKISDKDFGKFAKFLDDNFGETETKFDELGLNSPEPATVKLRISKKKNDFNVNTDKIEKLITEYADKNLFGVTFVRDGERGGEIMKMSGNFSNLKMPCRLHKNFSKKMHYVMIYNKENDDKNYIIVINDKEYPKSKIKIGEIVSEYGEVGPDVKIKDIKGPFKSFDEAYNELKDLVKLEGYESSMLDEELENANNFSNIKLPCKLSHKNFSLSSDIIINLVLLAISSFIINNELDDNARYWFASEMTKSFKSIKDLAKELIDYLKKNNSDTKELEDKIDELI